MAGVSEACMWKPFNCISILKPPLKASRNDAKGLRNLNQNFKRSLEEKFTVVLKIVRWITKLGRHLGNCIILNRITELDTESAWGIKVQRDFLLVIYQHNTSKTQRISMDCERIQRYLIVNEKLPAEFINLLSLRVYQRIVIAKYWTQNISNHLQPLQGRSIS